MMKKLREIKNIRLIVPAAAAAVLVIALAAAALLQVQNVTLEGSSWYTAEEFEAIAFPDSRSRSVLAVLIGGKQEIPFVDSYSVRLTGPYSATVTVRERDLAGCVNKMGSYMYFDRTGTVTDSSARKLEDIPEVSGLATDYIVLGDRLPMDSDNIFQSLLNVTQYLRDTELTWEGERVRLVTLTDLVRVDDAGNVTCVFGDISVYLGDYSYMEEKLLEMVSILPELDGRSGTLYLDTYDVNTENPSYVFK